MMYQVHIVPFYVLSFLKFNRQRIPNLMFTACFTFFDVQYFVILFIIERESVSIIVNVKSLLNLAVLA